MGDFDLSLDELRLRKSAKWRIFPPDVLPAWIAEMDFRLAEPIAVALTDAIARGDTGYAYPGDLANAYATFAGEWFNWELDPRRVSLTPDVLVGIVEILSALTPPGASIVVNSPVYPPFYRVVGEVHRSIVDVPLIKTETGYELDLANLERAFAAGASAYLLCSPHNPIGKVFDPDTLRAIAELAKKYNVLVMADEIHAPLTMPGVTFAPFLPISESVGLDAVSLASASKAWNLPGLKAALIVAGSEKMRERLTALPPELPYKAGNLGVLASRTAFAEGGPWLRELLDHLAGNRVLLTSLIASELPGVRYEPPQASYLAWLDCNALALPEQPVDHFLKHGRVALTRGKDFGPGAEQFVRVNMGTSATILTEVVRRMATALA